MFDTMTEHEFEHGPGTFPAATTLTDTRLGELLEQINGLIDIHADLKAEAQRRLVRGDTVPGFKLVSYTPPRRWKADAPNVISPKVPIWKPATLMTPTQALKALKGDDAALAAIEAQVETPEKRPVIAPEHDRRKTWEGRDPEAMFDIESEDAS
jgi:hypothetical protein